MKKIENEKKNNNISKKYALVWICIKILVVTLNNVSVEKYVFNKNKN